MNDVKVPDVLQDKSGNYYRVISSREVGIGFWKKQKIEVNPFDDSVDNFEIKGKLNLELIKYMEYEFRIVDEPTSSTSFSGESASEVSESEVVLDPK